MTTRILPVEEWSRVPDLPDGLDPVETRVLVVEQDGAIVGSWAVFRVVHAECIWIAEAHRGRASVAGRLLSGMYRLASLWGARSVMTGAMTDEVASMILRLGGVQLPGRHFSLPVGAK